MDTIEKDNEESYLRIYGVRNPNGITRGAARDMIRPDMRRKPSSFKPVVPDVREGACGYQVKTLQFLPS